MKRELAVESVMTPFPHAIGLTQPLTVARDMMEEHNIRHLPVQQRGELVGVLSDRDLYFALAVDGVKAEQLQVESAYTADPYVVEPTTGVDLVSRRMAHDHIGCALVAKSGRLLGIFTTVDACRSLAEVLSGRYEQ